MGFAPMNDGHTQNDFSVLKAAFRFDFGALQSRCPCSPINGSGPAVLLLEAPSEHSLPVVAKIYILEFATITRSASSSFAEE